MPAAIPIVATVAAGAAAIGGYTTIALAITIAAQVSTQLLTKKPSLGAYRDTSERKQVLRAAASPKTVVYGRTISAGTLFFSEEEKGDQTDGEWLHLAITLAGHSLSGVGPSILVMMTSVHTLITQRMRYITTVRPPIPYATKLPVMEKDMIGKGISWLRVSLKFNAEKFPQVYPTSRSRKRGVSL
nr:hypothetical protein [Enterobacter cancerogenus]